MVSIAGAPTSQAAGTSHRVPCAGRLGTQPACGSCPASLRGSAFLGSSLPATPAPNCASSSGSSAHRRARAPRGAVRVRAFVPVEDIHDWRIKQMNEKCKAYYGDLWTHGKASVADEIIDEQCVHKDMVWDQTLRVGPAAMRKHVAETRAAYPDMWFEIEQVGVNDTTSLFVHWAAQATNLGAYHQHRPSYHNSTLSGITFFRFNKDRSKIVEIVVYRMPFAEDKAEVCEAGEEDMHTMHLARLHFEGKEGKK